MRGSVSLDLEHSLWEMFSEHLLLSAILSREQWRDPTCLVRLSANRMMELYSGSPCVCLAGAAWWEEIMRFEQRWQLVHSHSEISQTLSYVSGRRSRWTRRGDKQKCKYVEECECEAASWQANNERGKKSSLWLQEPRKRQDTTTGSSDTLRLIIL